MSRPWKVGGFQGNGVHDAAESLGRWDQEPVVRSNEERPSLASEGKGVPLGTDSRVYDRQVYCVLRHVPRGVFQNLRPRLHGEAGHFVRQVYNPGFQRNAEHRPFTQPDEIVVEPEV
jgi:hypothetical protein